MLSVSLEASFTSDGTFDFDATIEGLGVEILATDFGEVRFDPAAVLDAVGRLRPPDLQAVLQTAGALAASIDLDPVLGLDLDGLLAPLNEALSALDLVRSGVDLSIDAPGVGLGALTTALDVGLDLFNGPLQPIAGLLGVGLPGLDLGSIVNEVTGGLGGLIGLVALLGGLLAVEAVSARVERGARLVAGMLNAELARADSRRLQAICRGDLPERIAGADLGSGVEVNGLLAEIAEFVLALRSMQESWAAGLGRGEAALVGLGMADCGAQLDLSRAALDEALVPLVGAMASDGRARLAPMLDVSLPDPLASADEAFDAMLGLLDPLRHAIDGLADLGLTETIGGAVDGALGPVVAVTDSLGLVASSVSGALRQVGDLVDAIDLQPLLAGVSAALRPVTAVLDDIDAAITVAQAAIATVAQAIVDGLDEVTGAIDDVTGVVQAAFGDLSVRLGQVDFEAVQTAIAGGLGQVAALLASADLAPYFDTANDIIDTTAAVIDKVPFGLLPTDIQQEIVDLSRPVKQIDFDAIADGLRAELGAIMDSLNGEVLDEVDAAYQAVIAFLTSIDPAAAIAEFEAGPFTELRAVIDGIDPQALLAPVEEALAPVRSALDGIDLTTTVLDPVAVVFTAIGDQLDQLDPATMLAPLVAEVDQIRGDVIDRLDLPSWSAGLTAGRDRIVGFLDRLDPALLVEAASTGAVARLRSQPGNGPGLIGTVVGALGQASGLPAEAAAWPTVRGWLGPVDGRAEADGRLAIAAGLLAGVVTEVEGLDPEPAVVAASAYHRRLLQSLSGLSAGGRLQVDGRLMLEANTPTVTIGPLVENRQRYLSRLRTDSRLAVEQSLSGFSRVNVISDGLTDALLPLTSLSAWLRSLLGRFGLADVDRPWSELLDELMARFGPDRLLPPFAELIALLRDQVVGLIDSAIDPVTEAIARVDAVVGHIDLRPIVDELAVLHGQVVAFVDSVDPAVVLGPVLTEADAVIDRVAGFDPLDPIRAIVDDLQTALDTVFESVTPSVIFAPIVDSYATIVELASGLDVKDLLQPVLDALAEIEVQLEVGIEETAVALARLQDALPDHVDDAAASISGSVSVGLSL